HVTPRPDLLTAPPWKRIFDAGWGKGTSGGVIARRGAEVLGNDGNPEMVAKAAAAHPGLTFIVGDAHDFTVGESFDAVASNAALHWMNRDPDAVIGRVYAALRPGGRFVGELGGEIGRASRRAGYSYLRRV